MDEAHTPWPEISASATPFDTRECLLAIQEAAESIDRFTTGKQSRDYETSMLLKSAVERQFVRIGAAFEALTRFDEEVANTFTQPRRNICFRDFLVERYKEIDDSRVWNHVRHKVPILRDEVDALLEMD